MFLFQFQYKNKLENVQIDHERYQSQIAEATKLFENCDNERKKIKAELKELKLRESRLLSDNNELEEENISLLKQVSSLKSSQVEFETSKHDIRRLGEEVEILQAQVEEYKNLKEIAEKQVHFAIS